MPWTTGLNGRTLTVLPSAPSRQRDSPPAHDLGKLIALNQVNWHGPPLLCQDQQVGQRLIQPAAQRTDHDNFVQLRLGSRAPLPVPGRSCPLRPGDRSIVVPRSARSSTIAAGNESRSPINHIWSQAQLRERAVRRHQRPPGSHRFAPVGGGPHSPTPDH